MVLAFSAGANAYLISVAASDAFIKSLELVMLVKRSCHRQS
jgi:hypothetical protein